jgi:hypothetical protein
MSPFALAGAVVGAVGDPYVSASAFPYSAFFLYIDTAM